MYLYAFKLLSNDIIIYSTHTRCTRLYHERGTLIQWNWSWNRCCIWRQVSFNCTTTYHYIYIYYIYIHIHIIPYVWRKITRTGFLSSTWAKSEVFKWLWIASFPDNKMTLLDFCIFWDVYTLHTPSVTTPLTTLCLVWSTNSANWPLSADLSQSNHPLTIDKGVAAVANHESPGGDWDLLQLEGSVSQSCHQSCLQQIDHLKVLWVAM